MPLDYQQLKDSQTVASPQFDSQGMQIAQFDPTTYGVSPQVWAQMSLGDRAFFQSAAQLVKSQYQQGITNVSINQDLLNKAITAASSDPLIVSTYGDAAKEAQQAVAFNLGQINANWQTQEAAQQAQQVQERRGLEQQIQTAGQAYSGFRQQAQQQLAAQQNNVIQSTRSQLQQQIQTLGSGYEKTYGSGFPGTAGASSFTAGTPGGFSATYQPVGGVIGSQNVAEQNAINNLGQQRFQAEQNPLTK